MGEEQDLAVPGRERKLILLVDDEPQIHRFLRPTLEAAGYGVLRADTGAAARREAALHSPSLILLDLGLPDLDGQDVLARLRVFTAAPVVVLSARDRPQEKIRALDRGAQDYVEKPFDMGELLARLRATLRDTGLLAQQETVFDLPPLSMDLRRRLVTVDNSPIVLTPREYDLLALLVRNAGRVITHRQLLAAIWGPAHTADVQYLRVYIGHLRQKLGPDAGGRLMTEAGVGYRMRDKEGTA